MITGEAESLLVSSGMAGDSVAGATGALSDGLPCQRYGCVACCLETEMPLTEDDLKRIEKRGYKRAEFTVEEEGETRLKNGNGVCFFLEGGRCMIYEGRPEGCRIYPLVYEVDSHKFVYDMVCPHSSEFSATREDKDRLKRLIRRLDREAEKRA